MPKNVLAAAIAGSAILISVAAVGDDATWNDSASEGKLTLAVYGDAPYGTSPTDSTQTDATPAFIDSLDADPNVSLVLHVGDIHSGKQYRSEEHTSELFSLWTHFKDPLI